MPDIRVGTKVYKEVQKLSKEKNEHILQLLDAEIANYKNCIKNYPPERMEKYGVPFLNVMENEGRYFKVSF